MTRQAGLDETALDGAALDGAAGVLRQVAALQQAGRLAETVGLLERAVALAPGVAALRHDLALTLLMLGRVAAAVPVLEQALAIDPGYGPALLDLGKALEKLGRAGFAALYERAVAALPGSAEARARLASALEPLGRRGEALRLYREAAGMLPAGDFDGLIYAARAAFIEEDLDAAARALGAALALRPGHGPARGMLARVRSAQGAFAAAAADLEAALAARPDDVSLYYNLVKTRRMVAADAPLIARMRAARGVVAPARARLLLEHGLAKALDDVGDYAGAAEALLAASALRAAQFPMDRDGLAAETARALGVFTPAYFARAGHLRGVADGLVPMPVPMPVPVPVMVLGLPRSGTTLTERILARHSRVAGAGEVGFWGSVGPGVMAGLAADRDADVRGVAGAYVARLRALAGAGAAYVVDKNPFNYRFAMLAHLALPGARIVHCRRHIGDNAVSIMMAALRPQPMFGTSREDLVFCVAQYEALMARARAVVPADRYYEVAYERLVSAPEVEIRALLGFLGLEFEAACLHPEADERAVLTASVWQARQGINAGSVGRWRRYAGVLAPFLQGIDRA